MYSQRTRRAMLATSGAEPILELIEITHPDLAEPARFVNDTENVQFEGHTFYATAFRVVRPDDVDQQTPQARLSVDNIGRELTQWLEYSNGGKGARCRFLTALRSNLEPYSVGYFAQDYTQPVSGLPDYDMTLDLSGISITNTEVSGVLSFKNTLDQPAVAVRYDPFTSPGMW